MPVRTGGAGVLLAGRAQRPTPQDGPREGAFTMADSGEGPGTAGGPVRHDHVDLIPREFLRVIAIWSLIPSYSAAGGFLGYLADRFLGWFPYLTGAGLLIALVMAVRDVYRLRDEM